MGTRQLRILPYTGKRAYQYQQLRGDRLRIFRVRFETGTSRKEPGNLG